MTELAQSPPPSAKHLLIAGVGNLEAAFIVRAGMLTVVGPVDTSIVYVSFVGVSQVSKSQLQVARESVVSRSIRLITAGYLTSARDIFSL